MAVPNESLVLHTNKIIRTIINKIVKKRASAKKSSFSLHQPRGLNFNVQPLDQPHALALEQTK